MADIGSVLDTPSTGGSTYYDESQDTPPVPMPEGNYPAHVIDCETATRPVRGKHRAVIYNLKVKVAKEAGDMEYDGVDMEGNKVTVNGSKYVGRELRSAGIFKFLHPTDDDDFESNPGGNRGYMSFCEAFGFEPKQVEVEINGQKTSVKEIPDVTADDLVGKPVMVVVRKGKPWTSERDGKTRTPLEAKYFNVWNEGAELSDKELDDDDDLPF